MVPHDDHLEKAGGKVVRRCKWRKERKVNGIAWEEALGRFYGTQDT